MGMAQKNNNLWINEKLFINLSELADELAPLETGGMLIGYTADNGDTVVTNIIGPGPSARHYRFSFTPDPDYQQQLLDEYFIASEGRETYLGDWHTHPNNSARLSLRDKKTLSRIANTPSSGTRHPIMAILSNLSGNWEIQATQFESTRHRFFIVKHVVSSLTVRIFNQDSI